MIETYIIYAAGSTAKYNKTRPNYNHLHVGHKIGSTRKLRNEWKIAKDDF